MGRMIERITHHCLKCGRTVRTTRSIKTGLCALCDPKGRHQYLFDDFGTVVSNSASVNIDPKPKPAKRLAKRGRRQIG